MTATCAACGEQNGDGRKFCGECGASLAPVPEACTSCGTPYSATEKFCGECGARRTGPTRAASGAARPAEVRQVSVLFVDLVGYTSISESRDPEDVRTLLSAYFDTARTTVERYGGRVEKFIGDAVMAVWGSPVALEDDAERAVRAALELIAQVPAFGAEAGVRDLQARGGVVTGQAASVADPAEGLVVGDRVNTASRVQSAAAPGTVLVDEVTRALTEESVAYEDAGDHSVKGKSEPLHLWRATRVVAGTKGKGRGDGLEPAFVGRDTEFSLVKALLHDSMDRRSARLVTVVGEAGVGKSRLVWEFEKYTDGIADTLLWHLGRCPRYGDGVAYSAFAEIVRARFGIADEDPGDVVATKVADGLARYLDDPVERDYLIPRVGRLVGLDDGEGLSRDELFSGWRLLVERLSQSAPFVWVIEDAQWADIGLLDFVEHLLEWSAQTPVFVLMATRPDLLERRDGWGAGRRNATLIYLEALSPSAIASLIDDVVPDMPPDLRERIAERSDGIPLYVVETIRALLDQGRLRPGPDGRRYHVADDRALELTVPASLTALIAARLDALSPDSRSLVRTLSVSGTAFTRSAAGALSGIDEATLDDLLADLVHRDVLTVRADPLSPRRGEYQFNQALLQTVAYDTLSKPERRQLHAAAAEHLRTTLPDEGDEVVDVVATHYLAAMRAGQPDDADGERLRGLALDAYQRAADRAERLGATVTARTALEHAAGLTTSGSDAAQLLERAALLAFAGLEAEDTARLLQAASAAHAAAGDERNARRLLALRSAASRDRLSDQVKADLEDALAVLAQGPRDGGYAEVAITLASVLLLRGEPLSDIAPRFEDALDAAEASGDMVLVARGVGTKGTLMAWSGRPVEAEALFTFALATARSVGDSLAIMQAYGNLTDHLLSCDAPSALERAEEAVAQARRLGQRGSMRLLLANAWLGLAFVGRWSDLEEQTQAQLGDGDFGDIHARLSLVRAWQGRLEEAAREIELTEADFLESSVQDREILAAARATVLLAEGRDEEGLAAARIVMDNDAGIRREAFRVAMPAAAEAALRLGRLDDADAILEQVAGRGPGDAPPFLRAQAARYRARVRQARGDLSDTVLADLRSAVSTLDDLGYPYWAALARLDLATALADAGAVDEGQAAARDVAEAAEGLGAVPLRDRAVAFLEASSAVPA